MFASRVSRVLLTVDMLCANNLRVSISKSNADLQAKGTTIWERYQPLYGEKKWGPVLFWLNLPNCTIYSIWTSKKGQRWRKRCKNRPIMNWVIQVVVIVIDGRRVHIFLLDLWYFAVWFQCPIQFQVQAYRELLMRESLEIW